MSERERQHVEGHTTYGGGNHSLTFINLPVPLHRGSVRLPVSAAAVFYCCTSVFACVVSQLLPTSLPSKEILHPFK